MMKIASVSVCMFALVLGMGLLVVPTHAWASPLNGTYVIQDRNRAQKTLDQAIERTVADMNWLIRSRVRDTLKGRQQLCQQLSLAVGDSATIACTTTGRSLSAPSTGTSKKIERNGKTGYVTHKVDGNRLVQTIKGENGTSKATYTLSADGNTLTMSMRMVSSKMDTPLYFTLTYIRE